MSYGGVTEGDVRDLIHGCIFTRGPKDLHNTAVWIGGNNMSAGEQLLAMAQDALFAPFSVSIMLDSNGSNTTAVAAVVKIEQTLGDLKGKKVVILAGTGPVGSARRGPAGARTAPTSPSPRASPSRARRRASSSAPDSTSRSRRSRMSDPSKLREGAGRRGVLLNSGPAGVQMVPQAAWTAVKTLKIAVDLNAVPPLGIEGVEVGRCRREARRASSVRRVRRGQLQDQAPQGVRRQAVHPERPGHGRRGDRRRGPGHGARRRGPSADAAGRGDRSGDGEPRSLRSRRRPALPRRHLADGRAPSPTRGR